MRVSPLTAGLLVSCLGLSAGCKQPLAEVPPRLRVTQGTIWEGQSALYLRGLNFSGAAKRTPDHHLDFGASELATLHASGVNSVRFLVFWNATAPEEAGVFDAAYLAGVRERVNRLEGSGLRVILDLHQDLWGEPFSPHGAPARACPPEVSAGYVSGSPWWVNYGSSQVSGCFDGFWSDEALQDDLAGAWAALAGAVCDSPAVIGWDLLNEPWPGSDLADPTFDQEVLLPFYRRVAARIDSACPGKLFFLEPSLGWEVGLVDPFVLPSGTGDPLAGRVVIAPHFYPTEVHEPDGAGYDGDAEQLGRRVDLTVGPFLKQGHAVWLGEWGGMTTQASFGAYVEDLGAAIQARGVGFATWDYGRSDGGFLFLDGAGARKPVFDGLFGLPSPTRMPGPFTLSADPGGRAITVETTCVTGARLELRRPSAGCACEAPTGSLGEWAEATSSGELAAAPLAIEAGCSDDGPAIVRCACP